MGHNILSIALAVMVFVIITVWLVLVFVLMPLVKENKKGYNCYAKKKKNGKIVATCKKVRKSRV